MDSRLARLIIDYQAHVAEAVAMLEAEGFARPTSNVEWATRESPYRGILRTGFKYYKHGFGCSVDGPDWGVDFDFGEKGQIDGFDAWRLFAFARARLGTYGFASEKDIEGCVKAAAEADELEFSGYILFYVTAAGRRSLSHAAG